ncbi:MAG: twin-arginine translocation signal domain-containing protein, partial [Acidobacteria bacterium]|nr:twin-arginine translocation signal domain-containing protein [Acidobacteriota bacterium]
MNSGDKIKSSEITPEETYLNRRNFLRAGLLAGTTLATAGVYRFINEPAPPLVENAPIENIASVAENKTNFAAGEEITSFK